MIPKVNHQELQKLADENQLAFFTIGIPIEKLELFLKVMKENFPNLVSGIQDEEKNKEAEMLFMDQEKVTSN